MQDKFKELHEGIEKNNKEASWNYIIIKICLIIIVVSVVATIFIKDKKEHVEVNDSMFKSSSEKDMEDTAKRFFDSKTKDALINHYKTISFNSTNGHLEVGKVEKIFDFQFPIYKVEYSKEYYKDGLKKYIDIDYIEVDNSKFLSSPLSSFSQEDFKFYKLNNFDKLILKCKNDKKCIWFNLNAFNKEDNISYEKIPFIQ